MLNANPTAIDFDVYQPRNPKASGYYLSFYLSMPYLFIFFES